MRYGFTIHALIASTAPTATTIVTTQSTIVGHGAGRPEVRRSTGPLTKAFALWLCSLRHDSMRA